MAIYIDQVSGIDCLSKTCQTQLGCCVEAAKGFLKERKAPKVFHCTFCIEHGKVKEVGFNCYKQKIDWHKRLGKVKFFDDKNYNMVKHAEIDAILRLGDDYDYSKTLFVNVHIDKNFACKNSKPCSNCLRVMSGLGVKRVAYFDETSSKFLVLKLKNKEKT